MLEDAVLLGDEAAVVALFEPGAVLITGPTITGPEHALATLATLEYVAAFRTVTVRPCLVVVIGHHAVNVSVRAPDGAWRLAAAVVRPDIQTTGWDGPDTKKHRAVLDRRSYRA
ncbi:MAG: hypothetical protein ABIW80_08720 [Lapillicoccus sp.]